MRVKIWDWENRTDYEMINGMRKRKSKGWGG